MSSKCGSELQTQVFCDYKSTCFLDDSTVATRKTLGSFVTLSFAFIFKQFLTFPEFLLHVIISHGNTAKFTYFTTSHKILLIHIYNSSNNLNSLFLHCSFYICSFSISQLKFLQKIYPTEFSL